ncbi:MAG: flagellar basal body rod protein FlgC [Nitrospirae bacterium]|jgi:flagellar basal-body rod protein FlgC|nr:flagellar basal body rod protein FlgC [Nitrospirota bacterium]NTW65144.1 flagellar basal body rod protein FlgC [Nitrospirota bacterium]
MDSFGVFHVSASALSAQRQRMNVIASNLANAHSTRTAEGGPYRRQDVVFTTDSQPAGEAGLAGVKVDSIVRDNSPFSTVYDPGHPDADQDGFVAMPNVNVIEEMVNMMMASRAYEASVTSFNLSKTMFLKTLELGKV